MTLSRSIATWQHQPPKNVSKAILGTIEHESNVLLGELVHHGYLLKDVPFNELRKDYLFDIFDALWTSHKPDL